MHECLKPPFESPHLDFPNKIANVSILSHIRRKGAQNGREFVVNLKVGFGQFYANTPFSSGHFPKFQSKAMFLTGSTERAEIANRNRSDFSCKVQIARKFRRKSAIFARNSQTEIAIASDKNSQLMEFAIAILNSHDFGAQRTLPYDKHYGQYITTAIVIRFGCCFPGKSSSKLARIVKYYGGGKTLRFSSR